MILFPADAFGLDPLSPPAGEVSPWQDGEVLLTGPAGLLGSALLERLLNSTNATVHCLVRPTAEATAEHRLRDVLEGLGRAVPDDRCRVVEGDLAAPRLGLDAESHARLADRIDLILHVGAKVAWWGDVSEIRATNLDGLRSIVELAATGRPKRLAFGSSVAVFNADAYRDRDVVFETALADESRGLRSPYVQSKWGGERICGAAAGQGVPTSILRVPYLLPHSQRPRFNANGAVDLLLAASIGIGTAPDLSLRLPLCPVDVCADWTLGILGHPLPPCSFHHLVPYENLSWAALVEAARGEGHSLEMVPATDWFESAREASRTRRELRPIVTLMSRDPTRTLWSNSNICRLDLDDAETRSQCPDLPPRGPMDAALLGTCVRAIAKSAERG
jgi:thioester reductase-like protein